MKLVTPSRINTMTTVPAYVPGKCNIGRRGRTMRMATGISIILVSIVLRFTLLMSINLVFSLSLILPLYIGFISLLEGSMSFCVLHASRGTFDLSEPGGFPKKGSSSIQSVESEEWKKIDRAKARRMHIEALVLGIILAVLLALA